jgi:hypothetical protein
MNTQKLTLGLIVLFAASLAATSVQAQEEAENQIEQTEKTKKAPGEKVIPFQLTFISPLGTNGIYSGRVVNHASINILAGVSGGVIGAELGGLSNFSKGDIRGLQAAGLFNGSMGIVKGVQLSGLGNYNKEYVHGLQVSGLTNVNTAAVVGVQLSGIFNYAKNHVEGVQASGLINTASGDVKGLQLSGITNVATKPVSGAQISGLVNTTIGTVTGLQLAGITNVATKPLTGAQIAGLVNSTSGDVNGLQLAAITNVATNRINGAQIGLFNYAQTIKGFQFGLINVADSVEKGAALGLFTYIRHGYHRFEIEVNETFYANATFKSGVERLYTIYTMGFKHQNGINYWAPGIGIGSLTHMSPKLDINLDIIVRQVNEGEWWTNELNLLHTLDLNLAYKLSEKVTIYGGPSFNVVVSEITDDEGNIIGDSFSPSWNFSDVTNDNNRVKMYVGFNAGIRF